MLRPHSANSANPPPYVRLVCAVGMRVLLHAIACTRTDYSAGVRARTSSSVPSAIIQSCHTTPLTISIGPVPMP